MQVAIVLILVIGMSILLMTLHQGYVMCKTRAQVEITYSMVKFLTVEYVANHPESEETFTKIINEEY